VFATWQSLLKRDYEIRTHRKGIIMKQHTVIADDVTIVLKIKGANPDARSLEIFIQDNLKPAPCDSNNFLRETIRVKFEGNDLRLELEVGIGITFDGNVKARNNLWVLELLSAIVKFLQPAEVPVPS
jgi:hypothetical protein